jgi:hypothetical protein
VGEITMDEVCSAIYTIAKIRPLLTQWNLIEDLAFRSTQMYMGEIAEELMDIFKKDKMKWERDI